MKNKSLIWLMLGLMALVGCKKYETQYEGPYSDGDVPKLEVPHEILFVSDGQVTLLNKQMGDPKILENAPSNVQLASINYEHTLIACKAEGQDIVVLDSNDVQIATISNTANVTWFDWHPNNETLIMLNNDYTISTYGPSVEIADNDLSDVFPFFTQERSIGGVSVDMQGKMCFTYRYYDGLNYQHFVVVRYPASQGYSDYIAYLYSYYPMKWMRSTADGVLHAFGTANAPTNASYSFDSEFGGLYDWGYDLWASYSPDGFRTVQWDGQNLVSFSGSGDLYYPVSGQITALDW